MASSGRGKLTKRPAVPGDLDAIEELCRGVHFDVGSHNAKLYYETCPQGWSVCVDEKDEVIAAAAVNNLSNGMTYGYITVVKEGYRGGGLVKLLMPDWDSGPYMGSSNELSIIRRGMSGSQWLEKRHGMYGLVQRRQCDQLVLPSIPGVRIELVRPELVPRLLDYDEGISCIDRRAFVTKWSGNEQEYGHSVVAMDENTGRCLGYGTMRLFSDYYSIQPLYADTETIAGSLMMALVKWCLPEDVNLYMPLMAARRKALEFCYGLGMIITGTEFRNCSPLMLPFVKSLPIEKVYSVHEYYPV